MVIDKIRKMSVRGVKLKSENFFSISPGVLELWRKNLKGADSAPGTDKVNPIQAGVFWNHIGWGGGHIVPPSVSPLFVIQSPQTWHSGTIAQNLSKPAIVKSIVTPL